MIVSSIRGRLRLRAAAFENPDLPLGEAKNCPGVLSVNHNPRTGSLLITYDPEELNPIMAGALLEKLDPEAFETYLQSLASPEKPASSPLPSLGLKGDSLGLSLVFTLLTLVVTGFAGNKKIHAIVGMAFLEMVAQHLYKYRKRLKRVKKKGKSPASAPILLA
ncbi:MAG: hypothetical protein LBO66_05305 [Deltaproteobacteria bacterium]|jgi:hypothetical protein|nr:hypothetical protein [Deltaproteobacteria bacterium]